MHNKQTGSKKRGSEQAVPMTPIAVLNEPPGAVSLITALSNDSVIIDGFTYSYDFLGSGDVRGEEIVARVALPRADGSDDERRPDGASDRVPIRGHVDHADDGPLGNRSPRRTSSLQTLPAERTPP